MASLCLSTATVLATFPVSSSPFSFAFSPLAAKPAEEESEKKTTGLWDVFATKWQQASALEKVAPKSDVQEQMAEEGSAVSGETAASEDDGNIGPDSDLRDAEGAAFKWSFLTNKLAEIRNKNAPKSN